MSVEIKFGSKLCHESCLTEGKCIHENLLCVLNLKRVWFFNMFEIYCARDLITTKKAVKLQRRIRKIAE